MRVNIYERKSERINIIPLKGAGQMLTIKVLTQDFENWETMQVIFIFVFESILDV